MEKLLKKVTMKNKTWVGDESGAVTVDWVVLCALLVVLVAAVISSIELPVSIVGTAVSNGIANPVPTSP